MPNVKLSQFSTTAGITSLTMIDFKGTQNVRKIKKIWAGLQLFKTTQTKVIGTSKYFNNLEHKL